VLTVQRTTMSGKRPRVYTSDDDDTMANESSDVKKTTSRSNALSFELPKLQGSSRIEIDFIAHIGAMLHHCGLLSASMTMQSLAGCQIRLSYKIARCRDSLKRVLTRTWTGYSVSPELSAIYQTIFITLGARHLTRVMPCFTRM